MRSKRSCDAGAQIKSSASHTSPEEHLACQNSKALTLRVPQPRRHTDSITSNDDIDTCTMEEARNLNFCRTNGGGASELQHKIVHMPRLAEISFQSISLEINYMNKNMNQ